MLEIDEIKRMHDRAFEENQTARIDAADDMAFFVINQWDDYASEVSLQYRGEFDVLIKAERDVESKIRENPVQPQFHPKDPDRKDGAEFLEGLYRADDHNIRSQEAYNRAASDMIICGNGAWELYTEYETDKLGEENQVIRRRYIPEANNNVFYDPNSRRIDRSDCTYVSILTAYTDDGYKDLAEELTGERPDSVPSSFASPEESYTFPWGGRINENYVATFYHKSKVKDIVQAYRNPLGEVSYYLKSDLEEKEILDDLKDFELLDERNIEKTLITKYIVSGQEILATFDLPGEHIPVIPLYGEFHTVEGQDYWRGIVRKAKDPQRARNFHMSYMMDIVSRSPRPKPIFFPEQIVGFEDMYSESGSNNNLPYYLLQSTNEDGTPLPSGPVAMMPEQPIPSALTQMAPALREAINDVASPGAPQAISDVNLSGNAVSNLRGMIDQQSYIFIDHIKVAKRRDAEVYASMASKVYDAPRTVSIRTEEGTTQSAKIMELVVDEKTGNPKVLNDITNMEFDVYAEIGPAFAAQKDAVRQEMVQLMQSIPADNPAFNVIMLEYLQGIEGSSFTALRKYARKMMLLQGFAEPETQEEAEMLQDNSQQQNQPDPASLIAMAEMQKAQADQVRSQASLMREQRQAQKDQADVVSYQAKLLLDEFDAQTKRLTAQTNAQKAGADINFTNIRALGEKLNNINKLRGRIGNV